jgi:hypothetical protein
MLYNTISHPEYVAPLREEIESVISQDGWSKAAVGRMWKLDSFIRETHRLMRPPNIPGKGFIVEIHRYYAHILCLCSPGTVTRMLHQDFTFSNGTTLPKGTVLIAANHSIQVDEVCLVSSVFFIDSLAHKA